MDKEFEKRIYAAVDEVKKKPIYSVFFDEPYYLQIVKNQEELEFLQEVIKDLIVKNPGMFKKDLDERPMLRKICGIDEKEYLENIGVDNKSKGEKTKEFKLEYEEITPYIILGIEEKEYTKEELLEILEKRINSLTAQNSDYKQIEHQIDELLDAYNALTQKKI